MLLVPQTEKGSALHEAALFGKADVVQKLLSAGQASVIFTSTTSLRKMQSTKKSSPNCSCRYSPGIDVNIVDQKGLTALDTVKDMPSQKSREIVALILGKG